MVNTTQTSAPTIHHGLRAGSILLSTLSALACYVGVDDDDPRRVPRLSAGDPIDAVASDGEPDDTEPDDSEPDDTEPDDTTDTTADTTADTSSDTAGDPNSDPPPEFGWVDPCAACGCLAWAEHLPSPSLGDLLAALAPTPDEGLLVAVATPTSLHLSRLAPDGALEWSHEWPGEFHDLHLTAAGDGLFALAVSFSGSLPSFGVQSAGSSDGILLLFDDDDPQTPLWHTRFGGADAQRVTGLAASPGCQQESETPCRLVLAGTSTGELGLGGLDFAYPRPYILELDLDGGVVEALAPPSAPLHDPPALTLAPDGAPILLTTQRDLGDLGDLTLVQWDLEGRFWTTLALHAPGEQRTSAVAVAPDGSVRLLARTLAPIEVASGTIGADGLETPFIAAIVDNAIAWARPLAAWPARGQALAIRHDGTTVITGNLLTNNVDLGGGTLPHFGASDAFVLQLGDSGAHTCSRAYGDPNDQHGLAVATHPDGRTFALVRTRGELNPTPDTWHDLEFAPEDLVVLALDRYDAP